MPYVTNVTKKRVKKAVRSIMSATLYAGARMMVFAGVGISLLKSASWCKLHVIIGSWAAFFSVNAFLVPLSGAFGGVFGSLGVIGVRVLLGCFFGSVFSMHYLAYYLPGLCASLYWSCQLVDQSIDKSADQSRVLRMSFSCVLPILCMLLFIAHPIGGQAFVYSFYWLIPVIIFFAPRKTIFLHALASTFIAHAVGSVIWLYTVPMSVTVWHALLPIVAVERLVFAAGMTLGYYAIAYGIKKYAYVKRVSYMFFGGGLKTLKRLSKSNGR